MFFGEYDHLVDAKNRIRIPSKFKQELSNGYFFVMGNGKYISIYPAENMEKFVNQFNGVDDLNADAQGELSIIYGSVFPGDEDGQGRVVIPKNLRDHACIDKDVVSVGMVNRIDIYAKEVRDELRNKRTHAERLEFLKGCSK